MSNDITLLWLQSLEEDFNKGNALSYNVITSLLLGWLQHMDLFQLTTEQGTNTVRGSISRTTIRRNFLILVWSRLQNNSCWQDKTQNHRRRSSSVPVQNPNPDPFRSLKWKINSSGIQCWFSSTWSVNWNGRVTSSSGGFNPSIWTDISIWSLQSEKMDPYHHF